MTTKNGTVNISIERFKELEKYESKWNTFNEKWYIYREMTYGRFGWELTEFITRKEFKDKLYKQMHDKIDILEQALKEKNEKELDLHEKSVNSKKCWFCKN